MKALLCLPGRKDERGAVAIIVSLFLLFAGIGFAAFAIDLGYLHVAKNELQNAADAGALAGARALYYSDGSQVNDDGEDPYWAPRSANEVAYDAATANEAAKEAVEVIFSGGGDNNHDISGGTGVSAMVVAIEVLPQTPLTWHLTLRTFLRWSWTRI
jgi:hypothetical protein